MLQVYLTILFKFWVPMKSVLHCSCYALPMPHNVFGNITYTVFFCHSPHGWRWLIYFRSNSVFTYLITSPFLHHLQNSLYFINIIIWPVSTYSVKQIMCFSYWERRMDIKERGGKQIKEKAETTSIQQKNWHINQQVLFSSINKTVNKVLLTNID